MRFYACSGFTAEARREAERHGALLIGDNDMILDPADTARFYTIWFPLRGSTCWVSLLPGA